MPARVAESPGGFPLELLILKFRLGKPENKVGFVALVLVLADVLAESDVSVPQTDAGAILALAQYVSGGGGGGTSTTDVYLWNMTGNVVPSKVEYVSGYSGGNPTYTELETEGITNEFNGSTVYGIKVKDCLKI